MYSHPPIFLHSDEIVHNEQLLRSVLFEQRRLDFSFNSDLRSYAAGGSDGLSKKIGTKIGHW